MNITRQITPEEMVGEFLKAELHSSRFRSGSLKALSMLGYKEDLLEHPDYSDKVQNEQRTEVLGLCRGWPDKELFTSFPSDTEWFVGTISIGKLAMSYRLKSSDEMTAKERLLSTTAQKLKDVGIAKNVDAKLIKQIANSIEQGVSMPPIILVAENSSGKKVLIEGHSRSISYMFVNQKYLPEAIPAIVGLSPSMSSWAYF
ncbi:MAG: hypothetical protein ABI354_02300 [Candidatus Saccharimonadales bacterium]